MRGRQLVKTAGRQRLFRFPADTDHPEGGDRESEPEPGRSRRILHPGGLPLPAGPCGLCESTFSPHSEALPEDVSLIGSQVGDNQPGVGMVFSPTGQKRTLNVDGL